MNNLKTFIFQLIVALSVVGAIAAYTVAVSQAFVGQSTVLKVIQK